MAKANVKFGIPQGSVIGLPLFILYTTPLRSMISGHAILTISMLYISFALAAALNGLLLCLASVQSWMSTNKLKLNSDKTEFLLIRNIQQWSKFLCMFPIELFGIKTNRAKLRSESWSNIWQNFTFHPHISAVCSSWSYHIRYLRHVCHHLDRNSAKLLAIALVSSCLNCWNSLLYGIVNTDLTTLPCIQNRLFYSVTKPQSHLLLLTVIHCFIGCQQQLRILLKIRLLTYKMLYEKQPVYLHSMLATPLPSHSLRSSKRISLSISMVKTNTGRRAFHSCALSIWNNVLSSVRSANSTDTFKKHLKTHAFDLAFPEKTLAHPRVCWCYGAVSLILLLNNNSAVVPLSMTLLGILALYKFDWLIEI